MSGPSDGWAVGFTFPSKGTFNFTPFAGHWDGYRWRAAALPNGLPSVRLNGVAVLSPSDAWAVGDAPSGSSAPLTMHWNGHSWAPVPSAPVPHEGTAELLGVAASSPSDVWAVGNSENLHNGHTQTLAEHWDGHRWRVVPSPDLGNESFLTGVTATSNGSAWAVGLSLAATAPFVLRWTGHAWVRAATPRTGVGVDVDLNGVTAVSPTQVWAVGDTASGTSPSRPYALRWNGHAWASVPVPNPGPAGDDRQMISVAAAGNGQLDAVGYDNGPAGPRPLHANWDGRHWSVRIGPADATALNAVAGAGGDLLAVGSKEVPHSTSAINPVAQVSP
jgi:hypothetical protein